MSAGDELPWLRANHSAASVAQGRPILAMCAPPMERVVSEYISFQKGSQVLGQISQSTDGRGVTLQSVGADVAEWHRVDPTEQASAFVEGEVVGVHAAGLSRVTSGASVVGVVSHQAIVKGGMPTDGGEYESVAYVGRLPMRVRGEVRVGDALVPSGLNDGVAVAATVLEQRQICAIALSVRGDGAKGEVGETWVDACIVPPAVGSSLALAVDAVRRESAMRESERDAQMAALAARLAWLEAALPR